jgi:hypothetical protein
MYVATYGGDPSASQKDEVRYLVGDTDMNDPLLGDREIEYFLTGGTGAINAAIRCCEAIAAKFSRRCDESVGQVRMTFSQQRDQYIKLRTDLQNRLAMTDAQPYAGGISRSDVQQNDLNTDRVKPDFTKHMMENDLIAPWTTDEGALLGDQRHVD